VLVQVCCSMRRWRFRCKSRTYLHGKNCWTCISVSNTFPQRCIPRENLVSKYRHSDLDKRHCQRGVEGQSRFSGSEYPKHKRFSIINMNIHSPEVKHYELRDPWRFYIWNLLRIVNPIHQLLATHHSLSHTIQPFKNPSEASSSDVLRMRPNLSIRN
jgi:hypothetical protein